MQTKFVLMACLLSLSACAHGRARETQLCMAQPPAESVVAPADAQAVQALQGRAYLDAYPLLEEPTSEWKTPERAYAQEAARSGL